MPFGLSWALEDTNSPMITMGIIEGGHVRVGLEDNIYLSKGVLAKSNAQLVEKAVKLANLLGRDVANCKDARQILHIKKG